MKAIASSLFTSTSDCYRPSARSGCRAKPSSAISECSLLIVRFLLLTVASAKTADNLRVSFGCLVPPKNQRRCTACKISGHRNGRTTMCNSANGVAVKVHRSIRARVHGGVLDLLSILTTRDDEGIPTWFGGIIQSGRWRRKCSRRRQAHLTKASG